MTEYPDHHLKFTLPRVLGLVPAGRHQPCIAGCVLTIDRAGCVDVAGTSRELVFEQARRFLRIIAKGHGAMAIAATLVSPPRMLRPYPGSEERAWGLGGRDSWSIIVGAGIAFSPTAVPPDLGLPELQERAG